MDQQNPKPMGQQQNPQPTTDRMVDQAKDKSEEMMQKAQDTAMSAADQGKGRAAETVGSVADALHHTGQQLRDQDQQMLGDFVERAADQLHNLSTDLQNKSVNDMISEVENFARRDPQLFLGGAVALGLVAARFLKSSSRRQFQQGNFDRYNRYGQQSYGTGAIPNQDWSTYGRPTPSGTTSDRYGTSDFDRMNRPTGTTGERSSTGYSQPNTPSTAKPGTAGATGSYPTFTGEDYSTGSGMTGSSTSGNPSTGSTGREDME